MSDVNVSGNLSVTKSGVIDKDLLVKGWLYAANVRDMYVGVFESSSQLPAAAKEKSIAGVVTTVSGVEKIIAWYKGISGWESTGAELSVDVDTSIQHQIDAINTVLTGKAAKSEMAISSVSGDATKKKIKLNNNVYDNFLVAHQDLGGYLPKPEGKVRDGEFASFTASGKIQGSNKSAESFATANHNHNGTYASINHNHQGVYSPVGHTHNSYASIALVAGIEARLLSGFIGSEMVRMTYNVSAGSYTLDNFYKGSFDDLMMAIVGNEASNEDDFNIEVDRAGSLTIGFIFADAYRIPENAFDSVDATSGITLTNAHLPSYIHEIGNGAFSNCTGLEGEERYIECEAMTPPVLGDNSFDGVNTSDVKLRIHSIAYEAYKDLSFTICDMAGHIIEQSS